MSIRFAAAQAASTVSTAALKHLFRRPAGNFPGKVALYLDPQLIADLAPKLARGSICVVGTNGKTTCTALIADALEENGSRVVCNRTGANLDSGVATSLLQAQASDWGVFECDEMWLAKIVPYLEPNYVLLLNLFPDQLDRVGTIGNIQESIAGALNASPATTLVYNADDPHCEAIARKVQNPCIPFGLDASLGLPERAREDPHLCQECGEALTYHMHQYDQLGDYQCPACGFARPTLRFSARNILVGANSLSFECAAATDEKGVAGGTIANIGAPFGASYMVYNLLASYVGAHLAGVSNESFQRTADAFDPQNGRLQTLEIDGRSVLLNLAKNPAGFNQNLALIAKDEHPKAVAFFVNNKEGDGRDPSWLSNVDFESLAQCQVEALFVGGMCQAELLALMGEAGLAATAVTSAGEVMSHVQAMPADRRIYVIANYTALPTAREELSSLAKSAG